MGFEKLFRDAFWLFGALGAIVGLVSAGIMFVIVRLFQDHWR